MSELMICNKHKTCQDADKINCPHKEKHQPMGYCIKRNESAYNCQYNKGAYCIPHIPEFKVGDKVRVLGKTRMGGLSERGCSIGDIGEIESLPTKGTKDGIGARIGGTFGSFNPQDLELTDDDKMNEKNELKIKYKATGKELNLEDIIKASDHDESENFIRHYLAWSSTQCVQQRNVTITINDKFMDHAMKHDCFIKWLVENGYVEEIEPEIFYKRGDRFKYSDDSIAELCIHWFGGFDAAYLYASLVFSSGVNEHQSYSQAVKIEDQYKISEKELAEILGSGTGDWQKI